MYHEDFGLGPESLEMVKKEASDGSDALRASNESHQQSMKQAAIIEGLTDHRNVFRDLLQGLTEEVYLWKPNPEKWCLLEILCHLYDEEREDFRARIKHVLESPTLPLQPFDPQDWVKARNYLQQHYEQRLNSFLDEREQSIRWLKTLTHAKWDNASKHPEFGDRTAHMFLCNWLAHDYLHIRQIIKLKYDYLKMKTNEDLNYAGSW